MKNTLIRFLGSLFFSLLFYNESFGLNILLFSALAIGIILLIRRDILGNKEFQFFTIVYFLSSVFVFTSNSVLSIVTCMISFLVFAGSISGINNSVYVKWMNGVYQSLLGAIHHKLDKKNNEEHPIEKKNYAFIILTTVIVTTLLILFTTLYGQVNPILGEWISKINLDFINIGWIITTIMGYILLVNITSKAELDVITIPDRNSRIALKENPITENKEKILQKEKILGTVVLGALNALIILFIVTDVWYVTQNPLEDAATLSTTVHEGVSALITSILIAICTILIIFRGDLNFYKKSQSLRSITYLWIALNILIILLTAYKNYLYSSGFGLTYKRIGVFIYLALCISGMITTYIKLLNKHNFLFMVKANAQVAFIVLICISSFNWDRSITIYNLSQVDRPDLNYLLKMSDSNGDLLFAFAKANPEKNEYPDRILDKYKQWHTTLSVQSWQSKTLQGFLNPQTKKYEVSQADKRY